MRRGTGWVKDIHDPRDHTFTAPLVGAALPPAISLWTPPIVDQGRTNSCVGNATASLFRYMMHLLGQPDFQPSRMFNYWYARKLAHHGWETEDEGAMPRDAMQSMISNGVVDEADWPFDPARINEKPPDTLLPKAYKHRIVEGRYVRMLADDNLYHLKFSLAQQLPFLVGIPVYTSFFDTGSDGLVPDPKDNETYEGGHLMYCNGYNDAAQRLDCPNSWSEDEGDRGVFRLSYNYIAERAEDFWRTQLVTG